MRATIVRVSEWVIPALGVALSPLPILAMLLFLGGNRPTAAGSTFWLAWTLGVAAPTIAFVALAESSGADEDSKAIAVAEIAVGAVFLAVAARVALRCRADRAGALPRWLEALDRSGPRRAAAVAIVLSSLNPKNLALILAGAVAIAQANDAAAKLTAATLGFLVVAVSTVSLLLAGFTVFPEQAHNALRRLRAAVARNDRSITIVLGVLIGAFFVLDGVRGL